MKKLALSYPLKTLKATLVGDDAEFGSVSTDSRSIRAGDLYVALKGARFDGHEFIKEAREKGAAAVMVDHPVGVGLPQMVVADTRRGLGALASVWRKAFPRPLLAITGSNGKTTVKEMCAAILAQKGSVLATRGNLNNDIGMPLTLLRQQEEEYLVIEMGANHPGEIDYLTRIARPDVALITNAGSAHLEGFGSIEGVAQAKGEIIQGVPADGVVVLNADDLFCGFWRDVASHREVLTFGMKSAADVRGDLENAETLWTDEGMFSRCAVETPQGSLELNLKLAGQHNLLNALAAAAATLAMGASLDDVATGLESLSAVKGRLQVSRTPSGVRLIDDSYNANPDSVTAAIAVLASAPGERWLVLGDLAELGPASLALHRALGQRARDAGIEHLYTVGRRSALAAESFGEGARAFTTQNDLMQVLQGSLSSEACVLVKGSRSAAMDRVVDALSQVREG